MKQFCIAYTVINNALQLEETDRLLNEDPNIAPFRLWEKTGLLLKENFLKTQGLV